MKPQFYILSHVASKCSRECKNKNCDAFNENQQNGIRWLRLNINTNKDLIVLLQANGATSWFSSALIGLVSVGKLCYKAYTGGNDRR